MGAFSVYFGDGRWQEGRRTVGGCGLSGQVCCVGQRNCRRRVVCRVKYGEWVKGIGDGVWSVGSSMASGSRGLSADVVCRVKYGEWVKRIVGGVWSVGSSMASGSKELSAGVVCRRENGEWVKRPVGACGLSA